MTKGKSNGASCGMERVRQVVLPHVRGHGLVSLAGDLLHPVGLVTVSRPHVVITKLSGLRF